MPISSRSVTRPVRGWLAVIASLATAIGSSVVPLTVAATGVAIGIAVKTAPALAQTSGPVLVLLQNGETTAPETAVLTAAGYTVTQVTPATWEGMSTSAFDAYAALVIGDPSSGATCSALVPTTGTSGSDALGTNWQAAVTGEISVLGTAPVLPGTSAANTLISDAVSYAASGWSSAAKTGTGLYESLNCEYSTSGKGTAVPLLNGVEGTGTAGGLTVQGSLACADSGTLNTWEAQSAATFGGYASGSLGGSGNWPAPSCPVREAFDSWPAIFKPLAYDAASDAVSNFTASDGTTGQPYILLGAPVSAATAALAPSSGGAVPAGAAIGGANPTDPGLVQGAAGDPVDTENGDFTQSAADLSVPGFGPPLAFSRTYDAQLAEQQTQSGAPGAMGYGWTDNWATSLAAGRPVPDDIYTIDGLATNTGDGGPPAKAAMNYPGAVRVSGGDVYIADTNGNRIEEIPGTSKTQWGIPMTAGDIYTVAGSDAGASGDSANGTTVAHSLLNQPMGVAVDNSGNLYIADAGNNRVVEIAAASGTQWGSIPMTANDLYTVAGSAAGTSGTGTDGKAAPSSDLLFPTSVFIGGNAGGNLYIADSGNSRIQMVSSVSQSEWGQTMTANDVYTVAGSAAGDAGDSGNGGKATLALLFEPQDMCVSSAGDLYLADTLNNRVQEVAKAAGTEWGIPQTANDIYTVAGNAAGNLGVSANGTAATSALLDNPTGITCQGTTLDLYIDDTYSNEIQEVPSAATTAWNLTMGANKIYTIAGSASGTQGFSGNGGAAASALLFNPQGPVGIDASGDLEVADTYNDEVRQVSPTSFDISDLAGGAGAFAQDGDGGTAVNAGLSDPNGIATDSAGDVFIADIIGNRVQEISASNHTQFNIPMTAGDVYTVAGSAGGYRGFSGDGGKATSARLSEPSSVAVDAAGDLYIDDWSNCRIQEVSASTGDISTIAGSATGNCGDSGDGGPATSALLYEPFAVAVDASGDVFIADSFINQVQEVPATTGNGMTKGDIYTLAGNTSGLAGTYGDGGQAVSSLLSDPDGIAIDASGDVYISDSGNHRVQEIAGTAHTQWGQPMFKGDIYTVVGSAAGSGGNSGNGGPAASALLGATGQIAFDSSGDLYLTDTGNNQVREVAAASGTQWGQLMTAGDIYRVTGSASGNSGESGDGGAAGSALLNGPDGVTPDSAGDIFVTESSSNRLREVTANANAVFAASPLVSNPSSGGITINQADGSQVTFYPKSGSSCPAPYTQLGGQYCTLPQNINATLSFSSGTYTFSPSPGDTITFGSGGALESETDADHDTLTLAYTAPAPGSGNCPASASTCDTITAASGRALVLGLNAAGEVTSVTDPMGRSWTYGYAGADLTSATDPMGNVTSYAYGAGSTGNPLLANAMLTLTEPNAQPGGPDAGDSTVNVYNAAGQVISQTDPMGLATTFNYCVNAAAGDCMNSATGTGFTTITDPEGNTVVSSYTLGVLTASTTWNGGVASENDSGPNSTASGNAAGTLLPLWTANPDNSKTTYSYDTSGNQIASTDPLGRGSAMWETSFGVSSCSSDATAGTTCSSSDTGPAAVAPGGVITPPSSAPPAGDDYTLYDTDGNELYDTSGVYEPGSSTAAYSQTTYTLYKGNSVTLSGTTVTCNVTPPSLVLPCAEIDASGKVTQLGYDPAGDLTSASTPDGNGSQLAAVTYAYNTDGEATSSVAPDGNVAGANAGNYTTVTAYNADGQATSVTLADGTGATVTARQTKYGYDADGNETSVIDPRGYTTTTRYNADDGEDLVTNPDSGSTLTCYDGDANVTQTVPPAGVAAGNLTPASCPASYPAGYGDRLASDATTQTYNASGQVTSVTTPAPAGQAGSETTSYSYDPAGNATTITGPPLTSGGANQVTQDTYDADGDLVTETTASGTSAAATVSYCYDPNDDRTAVVAPDGNASGVAACETSSPWVVSATVNPTPAAYQSTSSYDSAGELVSSTTPATTAAPGGATTTFSYDPDGDLLTTTDPGNVTATYTYGTPGGNISGVSYSGSSAHSVSYAYDAQGNQTGMTDATGSSSAIYDPFGELTSTANGAGQTVGYGYDADGDVTGVTYPLPASATWAGTDTVSLGYDHADTLTSVTDFSNHQISVTPNADGLPSSETLGSTGDTISYSYDPTDAASSIALKNSSSTLQSFSYSDAPAGDIITETDTPASSKEPVTYTYDGQGRVTSMTPGSGSALDYAFDASGNLTTLPTGASGSYDHDGELTSAALSGSTTSYTYNAAGERRTSVQSGATITSATWNGAEQLTAYDSPSADMTGATYDGNGLRASMTAGSGTQDFVWGGSSQLLMDSANAYIYAGGRAPAEQVNLSTGAISYLDSDALGSVRGIISSSGALTASTSYDAWGNPQTTGGLASYTPFGFAGGYTDPTGLIYLINRYYDPSTGQFMSVDPDVAQTGQSYDYADGNPVDGIDPDGLWMIGIPSYENSFDSENAFETWVNNTILGGDRQYALYTNTPGQKHTLYRRVDIYSSGQLNELKIGKQYNLSGNQGQAQKDANLIKNPGNYCNYHDRGHDNDGCFPVAITGGDWWFGYKGSTGCQRSNNTVCPSSTFRAFLLGGQAGRKLNVVLVWYLKNGDFTPCEIAGGPWCYIGPAFDTIADLYKRFKNKIRGALESNNCPSNLESYLPVIKFADGSCAS